MSSFAPASSPTTASPVALDPVGVRQSVVHQQVAVVELARHAKLDRLIAYHPLKYLVGVAQAGSR